MRAAALVVFVVACGSTRDPLVVGAGDATVFDSALSDGGVDGVTTTFAFVGCNRLQKADWSKSQNPSSANTVQLAQTFADVAAITKGRFFFAGDLVLGLDSNVSTLTSQLAGWKALYDADPNTKSFQLVPLPGNHEMLYKDGAGNEVNNAAADGAWTSWLTSSGLGAKAGNGPTSAGANPDLLTDDQSKLSYSFDEGDVHYVLLNTDTINTKPDPSTGSNVIGWVPLAWLTADLAAAQANTAIHSIFVIGHKPLVSPSGNAPADAVEATLAPKIEALLDTTTKVKGYLCAHAHLWDARKLPGNRGVYQVVAGNGGSQPAGAWSNPYYGFTEVRIYGSGRVGVVDHRRPVPNPYNGSPAAAAVAQPEIQID